MPTIAYRRRSVDHQCSSVSNRFLALYPRTRRRRVRKPLRDLLGTPRLRVGGRLGSQAADEKWFLRGRAEEGSDGSTPESRPVDHRRRRHPGRSVAGHRLPGDERTRHRRPERSPRGSGRLPSSWTTGPTRWPAAWPSGGPRPSGTSCPTSPTRPSTAGCADCPEPPPSRATGCWWPTAPSTPRTSRCWRWRRDVAATRWCWWPPGCRTRIWPGCCPTCSRRCCSTAGSRAPGCRSSTSTGRPGSATWYAT